jgi:putative colanic acid biosysnthesis UDP-glucose lipid carrier transferase
MKQTIHTNQFLRQLIDHLVLVAAFVLTHHYVNEKYNPLLSQFNLLLFFLSACAWTITGTSVRLYDEYRKTETYATEFVAILKTSLLHLCVFTFLFFYCFKSYPYARTFTLVYSTYIFTGILLTKYLVKKTLLRLQARRQHIKNVLIVGGGETAMNFYETIRANDHLGYHCVGFVDDQLTPSVSYLGKLSELNSIFESNEIDDVIVALPETDREQTARIIVESERAAKKVKIIADVHKYIRAKASMNLMGNFPVVDIRSTPLDDPGLQRLKRATDVLFALIAFTAFSWLFVIIAIAIKLTSKGPVFFKQERWGLRNRKITCYKFRSMVHTPKDDSGKWMHTMPNDNRVTGIGRFLRKTNLDELPQFFNVLMGDMSLVGPRPHATPQHKTFRETVEHYMLRHMVKPGITGWAQINGCRGNPNRIKERVEYDIWYIEHYSFWLDCQIIFQTIMNMIKGDKDAY